MYFSDSHVSYELVPDQIDPQTLRKIVADRVGEIPYDGIIDPELPEVNMWQRIALGELQAAIELYVAAQTGFPLTECSTLPVIIYNPDYPTRLPLYAFLACFEHPDDDTQPVYGGIILSEETVGQILLDYTTENKPPWYTGIDLKEFMNNILSLPPRYFVRIDPSSEILMEGKF